MKPEDRQSDASELASAIYDCEVYHRRFHPREHSFLYRFFWFCLDLDELDSLEKRTRWFGVERFRPFSLYARDHFQYVEGEGSLRQKCERYLVGEGMDFELGRVVFFGQLRVLGYVFNPVCYFYCYDTKNNLRAIVAQVTNTYREQKPYLVRRPDPGGSVFQKMFYVSPFLNHELDFRFALREPRERVAMRVTTENQGEVQLVAGLRGIRRRFSGGTIASMFFRFPLVTLQITFAIHWQALRLYLKRIPYYEKAATDVAIANSTTRQAANV